MSRIFLITISLSLLIGCNEKDPIEESTYPPFIVIGDYSTGNLILTDIKPDKTLYGFLSEESFHFECNNDFKNDFGFSIKTIWGQGGGFLYSSTVKIKTLTEGAFISTNPSRNPKIYLTYDTITLDRRWEKGEFLLLGFEITSYNNPFDYSSIISGIWNDITESYIGIKVNEHQLGWIKVDISKQNVRIYEYALVK